MNQPAKPDKPTKREVFLELAEFACQELDEPGLDSLIFHMRANVGYMQAEGISAAAKLTRKQQAPHEDDDEDIEQIEIEVPREEYRLSFTIQRNW